MAPGWDPEALATLAERYRTAPSRSARCKGHRNRHNGPKRTLQSGRKQLRGTAEKRPPGKWVPDGPPTSREHHPVKRPTLSSPVTTRRSGSGHERPKSDPNFSKFTMKRPDPGPLKERWVDGRHSTRVKKKASLPTAQSHTQRLGGGDEGASGLGHRRSSAFNCRGRSWVPTFYSERAPGGRSP